VNGWKTYLGALATGATGLMALLNGSQPVTGAIAMGIATIAVGLRHKLERMFPEGLAFVSQYVVPALQQMAAPPSASPAPPVTPPSPPAA
jgi:hypothetical protein